ncbi:hypothetical protein TIFTF001_038506 [Ficus carica]|uniref:DUF1985 domain-containing protein n=1 Tax=Ficus carica TaxID=3494 RepID=A0AA88JD49_FICCA|nr:hypothetical protein TIFTF001_038506 [Ficus carica]
MSEKNTSLERRSIRVTAKSSKRSSADKSPKNPILAIERMVSDAGLKRKQGEMDVKDSKSKDKISKSEEMSNAKFDNDDDAVKVSLLYIMFSIPLSNASAVKIDPKFFALADDLDAFNSFPWGVLS